MVSFLSVLLLLVGGMTPARAGEDQWTFTGGPPGQVYSLALDPTGQGTLYAGTSTGGLFKSVDGAQSWTSLNQGMGSRTVFSVAIDPTQPTTLYAGTNQGVYKSTDGGHSWARASQGILADPYGFAYVYALAVDPARPTILYAATKGGVYKSVDGGQNWKERNRGIGIGLKLIFAESLALNPANPQVLYAGVHYQGTGATVLKSQDGGESWVPLSLGLAETLVSAIALDPQDPQRVYVGTQGQGLLLSADGGLSWRPVGQSLLEPSIAALALVPANTPLVYAAGKREGIYRSGDRGATWERIGGRVAEMEPAALAALSASNLWLATKRGIFKSTNGGLDWLPASNGLAGGQVAVLAPNPRDPSIIYAGTQAGGVFRSGDGGASWQPASPGVGSVSALAVDPLAPDTLYAGLVFLGGELRTGPYKSTDGGQAWSPIATLAGLVVAEAIPDPMAPGRVYLGTEAGVFVSEDALSTWRMAYVGLPPYVAVNLLALHPQEPPKLYLVLRGTPGDLYQSENVGQSWSLLYSFDRPLSALTPSPAAAGLVYAAAEDALFRSSDGGRRWAEYPFPGPGSLLSLVPHPQVATTLYAGTSQGVYRSTDGGESWARVGPGLEAEMVAALALSPSSPSRLYAGTFGRGVAAYTAVPTLRVQPGVLGFLAEPGGISAGAASLRIDDASGGTFGWAAEPSPAGSWLSLSPSAGVSVPVTLMVSVDASKVVAPGSYEGIISISSTLTATRNSPQQVPVSLHVGALQRRFVPWMSQAGSSGW